MVPVRQQKDEGENEGLHNALGVQCPSQKTPWRGGGLSAIQGGSKEAIIALPRLAWVPK